MSSSDDEAQQMHYYYLKAQIVLKAAFTILLIPLALLLGTRVIRMTNPSRSTSTRLRTLICKSVFQSYLKRRDG